MVNMTWLWRSITLSKQLWSKSMARAQLLSATKVLHVFFLSLSDVDLVHCIRWYVENRAKKWRSNILRYSDSQSWLEFIRKHGTLLLHHIFGWLFMTWPSAGQVDLLQISRTRFGHPSGWFVEMGKWTEMDVLKKHERAQSPLLGFLAVWDWETLHDHIRWPSIRGACPARCEISNDQSVPAACCTWTLLLFSHTHIFLILPDIQYSDVPIEKGSKYFWSRNDEVQNQNYETGLWFDYDESQPIYEASGWIAQLDLKPVRRTMRLCKPWRMPWKTLVPLERPGRQLNGRSVWCYLHALSQPSIFSNMSTRHKVKLAMDIAASEFYNSEDMISD